MTVKKYIFGKRFTLQFVAMAIGQVPTGDRVGLKLLRHLWLAHILISFQLRKWAVNHSLLSAIKMKRSSLTSTIRISTTELSGPFTFYQEGTTTFTNAFAKFTFQQYVHGSQVALLANSQLFVDGARSRLPTLQRILTVACAYGYKPGCTLADVEASQERLLC